MATLKIGAFNLTLGAETYGLIANQADDIAGIVSSYPTCAVGSNYFKDGVTLNFSLPSIWLKFTPSEVSGQTVTLIACIFVDSGVISDAGSHGISGSAVDPQLLLDSNIADVNYANTNLLTTQQSDEITWSWTFKNTLTSVDIGSINFTASIT